VQPIDWSLISDDRGLALMTVARISATGEMYLADFKDTQALAYGKTKHFIGLSKTRGLRLGGHPLRMVDGLWYITEDTSVGIADLQISHEALCLRLIR
jgi:hypothetical protein